MRVPDFIVIGAHKAGTTSLHHYLQQHPEIFLIPNKGTDLLTQRKIVTLNDATEYLAQFEGASETQTLGEVSSVYLHANGVAARIKRLFPQVKIVAVLRNPAERAYSCQLWRHAYTPKELRNFDEILLNSPQILRPGLYGQHLETYLSFFEQSQIKLMLFDDFQKNPHQFFQELYSFIGVESSFIPDSSQKYHVSKLKLNNLSSKLLQVGLNANQTLKSLIPKSIRSFVRETLSQRSKAPKLKMSRELRAKLIDYYYNDIVRLQELTGLNCSHWLENKEF
jgi:Sulfotransferase domain